jgi:hypothetical protein
VPWGSLLLALTDDALLFACLLYLFSNYSICIVVPLFITQLCVGPCIHLSMLDGCVSLRVSERMPTVCACLAVGCDVSLMILHVWLGVYVALCVLSVVLAGAARVTRQHSAGLAPNQ